MGISGVLLDDESGGGGRIRDRDASVELSRSRWEIKGHEATREGAPQELGGGGAAKPLPAAHPGAHLFSPQALPSASLPLSCIALTLATCPGPPSPPSLCTPSQQSVLRSLFLHTLNSFLLWDLGLQTPLSTRVNSAFGSARRALSAVPSLTPEGHTLSSPSHLPSGASSPVLQETTSASIPAKPT